MQQQPPRARLCTQGATAGEGTSRDTARLRSTMPATGAPFSPLFDDEGGRARWRQELLGSWPCCQVVARAGAAFSAVGAKWLQVRAKAWVGIWEAHAMGGMVLRGHVMSLREAPSLRLQRRWNSLQTCTEMARAHSSPGGRYFRLDNGLRRGGGSPRHFAEKAKNGDRRERAQA